MLHFVSIATILKKINYSKIILILLSILLFTTVLCFCDDEEFGGLTQIDKKIEDIHSRIKGEQIIPYKNESILEVFFNRFYFVTVSTSMLGYGDIYPNSYKTRILTIMYVLFIFFIAFI
jgi:hypothetical protein